MADAVTAEECRDEARFLVRKLAGNPRRWGDSVEAGIHKAARVAGYPFGTMRKVWYGQRNRIPADLLDTLRLKYARLCERQEAKLAQERAITEALRGNDAAINDIPGEAL